MFDSPLIMAEKVKEEKNTFLQSILNRGPNKRQIKPAENNSLLQLALGEDSEDSEEDEDFEINEDDDEVGSGTDEEEDNDATMNKAPVSAPLEEASDNEGEVDGDDDDGNEEDEMRAEASSAVTVGDLIAAMKTKTKALSSQPSSVASSEVSASSKKVDIFICGICMDDVSDEGDEIVECDGCGITVHEGCYGINDEDSDSGKSNDSESPTELWFCDACKAGVQPDCELCPNLGGIFKETDTGQWVHLLCALYTPDVAFVKPEKLQCVTLSEMPPYKWGARVGNQLLIDCPMEELKRDCSLCEDERYCRTGVCIECDAAMCKTYFHVTCAQMYGLLSDVPEECDEDVADPLFAHCRLHADKKITANRRRTWLAYVSCYKTFAQRRSSEDKERAKQCLEVIQKEFKEKRLKNMPKLYSPTERVPRLLSTCPGACRQLFKKAELLGYSTGQTQSVVNVRRKWFVQPALTSEFVNYYHDRSVRLKEMHERQEELQLNNKRLQEEEQDLREKYHELTETIQLLSDDIKERRQESVHLHRVLCKLAAKDLPKPGVLEAKKDEKSPESQTRVKPIKLHPCATCNKTENQHLLVRCDTCHNYYHLACVDPPLSRMPKRSAKCLWQCSECDSDDDDKEMEVDVKDTTPISQSRQRRVIKEPAKFTPDKGEAKKHRKLHRKRKIDSAEGESGAKKETKKPKLETTVKSRSEKIDVERKERKKKQEDVRTECSMCKQIGNNTNLVRCDNCQLCYHFDCLDPPVKSNPKKRGYLWYCTECDESDEEDSDEESEAKQPDSAANSNEKSKENRHGEQKFSDGEETKKGLQKKEMAEDTSQPSENSSPCKEKKSA